MTMTQAIWDTLSREERAKQVDTSELHPKLIGLEGRKVWVTPQRKFGRSIFRVGKTTGWRPVHLAMRGNARGSSDVIRKDEHFATVTIL